MSKKVYVGNLPYTVTEDEIKEFFNDCGTVDDIRIITDRETGRSKGFGFVSFEDENGFKTALEKNNQEMGGRQLRINEARDRA